MTAINFPDTPEDGDVFSAGDRSWTWNDTNSVWESVSAEGLPSQDGQAGKVLKTDGSDIAWEEDQGILTGKAIAMAIVFGG
jgi:hypothetical protein